MCQGELVESGDVEHLGLIYMCDRDDCPSHSERYDCPDCGHPTAFVWIADDAEGNENGRWELRCFDPLCKRN